MKQILSVIIAISLPTAAVAGSPKASDRKGDPSRIVCRTDGVTGSRLGGRKRCMTAQEWAEIAAADRQSLERTQQQRYYGNEYNGMPGGPGSGAFGRLD